MSSGEPGGMPEIKVDTSNLYREDSFTDLKVASVRRLVPVTVDGADDASRAPKFMAQTHVMTESGPMPIQCQIEAADLEEALGKFPEAIKEAIERMVEEVRELQRQQSSRIVVPKGGPGGMPGGPGGMPGGPGSILS